MTASVFVDTNIFVYARDSAEPQRQAVAERWVRHLWAERTGRTSYQVLNEYFVTVTAKLRPGMARDAAWADVRDLMSWEPQPVDGPCLELGRHLSVRYQLSWWDSLIVAAAHLQHCATLLSEDLQNGAVFGEVQVRNPFVE